MTVYVNNDGLSWRFGPGQADSKDSGHFRTNGSTQEVELEFDYTDLTASANTILSHGQRLPKGARIESAEIFVTTAFAGGTTVDVGLIKSDFTTELDYNGFDAAVATAALTAGASITGDGALIGTVLSENGVFTVGAAGTYTAGAAKVRIKYSMD